jgi:uncharacterized membrane protein YccC
MADSVQARCVKAMSDNAALYRSYRAGMPTFSSSFSRWMQRWPAHVVNGMTVAIGIGLLHPLIDALAGPNAAKLAVSGAICVSLSDLPGTLARAWRRMFTAAALTCLTVVLIGLLRPFPLLLGLAILAIAFAAMMTMAWGPRAGPVSFAAILAIVFTMGLPPDQPVLPLAWWNLLGALVYGAWSLAVTAALQASYRRIALGAALRGTAQLLRSRADLLEMPGTDEAACGRLQAWVRDEAALAERLQAARDLLFDASDLPPARSQTAALLRAIDLRDILLASRLDLDLLGHDAAATYIRSALAHRLHLMAADLDRARSARRGPGHASEPDHGPITQTAFFGEHGMAMDDRRMRLLPALVDRVQNLSDGVDDIHRLLRGGALTLPLSRDQLRQFVAPTGWPPSALRAHVSIASPVFRHAIRAGLALGTAYYIALVLPWASHPQWLVLSVAVVLRGNIEQTLSRRNLRVLGTFLGCLVVLVLAQVPSAGLLLLVFVGAVGLAHGFSVERYLVTATAGTVMALLQAHLAFPGSGIPVAERLADTLLGALLAWGFSYVLPSWERRSLPQAVKRALRALKDYAGWSLRDEPSDTVAQRLARRQAYDALGAVATTLQRSAAEPGRVRSPVLELSTLLDHGQRLMAHLSMVRLILAKRGSELNRQEAMEAMQAADAALQSALTLSGAAADDLPVSEPQGLDLLPIQTPADNPLPWLQRRLQAAVHDSREVARAARRVLTKLG